jgi:hypothetical protein
LTTPPWNLHEVDSECVDAVDEAAKLCEDLAHHVEETSPEIDGAALGKANWVIMIAQTRARPPGDVRGRRNRHLGVRRKCARIF